jgi:predicted transcriptional regulator
MNLANTLDRIIRSLGIRISKYAERCGVPNSAMTNALAGKPVRAKTMKKLMTYPDLNSVQSIFLAIASIEDRRSDIGMSTEEFHIVPSTGETIMRIDLLPLNSAI